MRQISHCLHFLIYIASDPQTKISYSVLISLHVLSTLPSSNYGADQDNILFRNIFLERRDETYDCFVPNTTRCNNQVVLMRVR